MDSPASRPAQSAAPDRSPRGVEPSPSPPDAACPWESVTLSVSGFGGTRALGRVLEDWFEFLGGRPGEVVYVDGGSGPGTVRALCGLVRAGVIDRLQLLNPNSWENDFHRCYIQEHDSGALARRPYIVFVKPDVLPRRRGHGHWLSRDMAVLDDPGVFAVTMTHLVDPPSGRRDGYDVHDFASLNFSLMKRSSFHEAVHSRIGAFIDGGFRGEYPAGIDCQEKYRRALIEWAWRDHCRERGLVTLARPESHDWMIFHINKSGRKLLSLRRRMHAGEDVERHFNRPKGLYRPQPRGLSRLGRAIEGVVRSLRGKQRGA
ncbi:MAG: hypothetical protein JNK70_07640 [Phycisphaerae bacterium]|nr:hypothetical protein [Phycisphaerae bacterium]